MTPRPSLLIPCTIIAAAALGGFAVSNTLAQANYAESFQGVGSGADAAGGRPALVSRGWVFRNQSRTASSGYSPYWSEFGSPGARPTSTATGS